MRSQKHCWQPVEHMVSSFVAWLQLNASSRASAPRSKKQNKDIRRTCESDLMPRRLLPQAHSHS